MKNGTLTIDAREQSWVLTVDSLNIIFLVYGLKLLLWVKLGLSYTIIMVLMHRKYRHQLFSTNYSCVAQILRLLKFYCLYSMYAQYTIFIFTLSYCSIRFNYLFISQEIIYLVLCVWMGDTQTITTTTICTERFSFTVGHHTPHQTFKYVCNTYRINLIWQIQFNLLCKHNTAYTTIPYCHGIVNVHQHRCVNIFFSHSFRLFSVFSPPDCW